MTVCRLHCRLLQASWPWTVPGTPPCALSTAQRAFFDAVRNFDVESIEQQLIRAAGDDKTSELDVNALYEFPSTSERMSALHYAAFMNETWVGIFHMKSSVAACTNACTRLTTAHVLKTCDVVFKISKPDLQRLVKACLTTNSAVGLYIFDATFMCGHAVVCINFS